MDDGQVLDGVRPPDIVDRADAAAFEDREDLAPPSCVRCVPSFRMQFIDSYP